MNTTQDQFGTRPTVPDEKAANTQPSENCRVSVISAGKAIVARIQLPPNCEAPFYTPFGHIDNGLTLRPAYTEKKGVTFKVDERSAINIPNRFISSKGVTYVVKEGSKLVISKSPDGTYRIPSVILEDRPLRQQKQRINGEVVVINKPSTNPDKLENQFASALRFINNNRKEVRARLSLATNGELRAEITKTVHIK